LFVYYPHHPLRILVLVLALTFTLLHHHHHHLLDREVLPTLLGADGVTWMNAAALL